MTKPFRNEKLTAIIKSPESSYPAEKVQVPGTIQRLQLNLFRISQRAGGNTLLIKNLRILSSYPILQNPDLPQCMKTTSHCCYQFEKI